MAVQATWGDPRTSLRSPLDGTAGSVFADKLHIPVDVTVDQVADWWLGREELAQESVSVCDVVEPDCGIGGWASHLLPGDARESHEYLHSGTTVGEGPVSA